MLRRVFLAAAAVTAFVLGAPHSRASYDIYVSQFDGSKTGQVLKFDASGHPSVFATTGLNVPTGLAFDGQGNLLVSDTYDGEIRKFSSTGASLGVLASTNLESAYGLALDGVGNLYVGSNNDVVRLSATTGAELGRFMAGGTPTQIVIDAAGHLDVVNLNGGEVHQFAQDGTDRGPLVAGLDRPFGLAIGTNGELFVSELFSNRIRHFSSTGQDLGVFAASGLSNPSGLAFDGDGNLYVLNNNNGANGYVREFSSTGVDLGIVASGISGGTFIALRPSAVPEPGSLTLVGLGLGSLLVLKVRRRNP